MRMAKGRLFGPGKFFVPAGIFILAVIIAGIFNILDLRPVTAFIFVTTVIILFISSANSNWVYITEKEIYAMNGLFFSKTAYAWREVKKIILFSRVRFWFNNRIFAQSGFRFFIHDSGVFEINTMGWPEGSIREFTCFLFDKSGEYGFRVEREEMDVL